MCVRKKYIVGSVLFLLFCCTGLFAQQMEEFNGSYPSWGNVKLRFGAKGNGKDDDTKALQQAIDGLGETGVKGGLYTVLYLPAGTYNISSTLVLRGKIGITIIGEDPATTIVKWVGAGADTMFWANGSAFYKISRLSWDANNQKDMEAIGIHWKNIWNDGKSQSYASLDIEISDNNFTGFKYCISGGTNPGEGTGNNDSEVAIKRCVFQNASHSGVRTIGYNALDYWVWDCRFLNCAIGIASEYGNFHAYRCYFKNSLFADVVNVNGYYKSLRGCYSEDGGAFNFDNDQSSNPFKRIFQANTVIRPKGIPIQFFHWGNMFFMDNYFDRSTDSNITSFAKTTSGIISINNTFRSKLPVNFTGAATFKRFNDANTLKLLGTGTSFAQTLEKTPAFIKRSVFEVPANADEVVIQQLINTAVKLKGQKPIIHFAAGHYTAAKTLLIPAGADIQFIGDGPLNASMIFPAKNFPAGEPVIRIMGPTNVSVKEIQIGNFIHTQSTIDAIQFIHVDQDGSRAFIDQLYAVANNSLRGEGLDNLFIQKDNSFFADNDFISGGPLTQAGKSSAGIFGFGGQFAGVSLQGNGKAVYKDCWWEGPARLPLNLSGYGRLTIDGAMIAPAKADSSSTVSIRKFKGNISLLNMYLQGSIEVTPDNPDLQLLLLNIHFFYTMAPLKFLDKKSSLKGVFSSLTKQCFIKGNLACNDIFKVNDATNLVADVNGFIPQLLADDRNALPLKYEVKNSSASNILITRTSLGDINNAIKFTR